MKAVSQDAGIFVDDYTLLTGSISSLQFFRLTFLLLTASTLRRIIPNNDLIFKYMLI